ncbi:MAG: cellulase family glycosylhydrolase [Phycisphaerae bacterium]
MSWIRISAAVMAAVSLAACAQVKGGGGGIEGRGILHTRGEDMVDAQGHKVMLRGVGLGNWMLPEGYMWRFGKNGDRPRQIEQIVTDLAGPEYAEKFWREYRANYITEADIQRIAALGFNCVRPSMNARLFLTEGENPQYREEGFELLDNLVTWCHAAGIYVIVDMHAAPGGQTGTNIDDSAHDQPELFMDPKNQDRLVKLWVKIAERYKNEPAVGAYDLLNEPLPQRTGAAAKYKHLLEPLYMRIATAIRQVDQKHMITVEGANWANDWSVFTRPFDENMFLQFHYYCWDNPSNLKPISQYLKKRDELKVPIWAGETGERDDAIYWGTTENFEAHNIGWSFWPWKKMVAANGPYGIKAPGHWEEIVAYSQEGEKREKPSREVATGAFNELLTNIRLENCVFHADVVNAMFRKVPGKVEAENYGVGGAGVSYSVKGTGNSKYYRKGEPVPVEPCSLAGGRRAEGQFVKLGGGEWTAYMFGADQAKTYAVTVRARGDAGAKGAVTVNGERQEVEVGGEWKEISLKGVGLKKSGNEMRVEGVGGEVGVDWVRFE